MNMNAVGIDVSKGKSMVCLLYTSCYYAPCHSALMIHRTPLQVKKYNLKCMKRGTECICRGSSGLPFCRKEGRINDNGKVR